jgi:branched-chain amino acid transport system substrate-binding protein
MTLAALCLAGAACSTPAPSAPTAPTAAAGGTPYNVALLSELTGPASAAIGVPVASGVQAYVKEANAAGGVNGHPIKLTQYDGQSDVTAASAAVRQVIADKPDIIVGYLQSAELAAVLPQLDQAGIPTVLGNAGATSNIGPKPKPWLFETNPGPITQSPGVVAKVKQVLGDSIGRKNVTLEFVDTPSTAVLADLTTKELKAAGAGDVSSKKSAATQVDFSTDANNIVASKPDAVVAYLVGNANVQFAKALATAGYSGPIIAWVGGNAPSVISGIASPNYFGMSIAPQSAGDVITASANKYGATPPSAGQDFSLGWASGAALAAGLKGCKSSGCVNTDIQQALESSSIAAPGVLYGPIQFSPSDHEGKRTFGYVTFDKATQKVVDTNDKFVVDPDYT